MIFVDRFAVDHRFDWGAVVVRARQLVAAGELGPVTVLAHVEIEPGLVVKPRRRTLTARRVQRDQMCAAVTALEPARQRSNDLAVRVSLDRAIATKDPHDSGIAVTAPEPLAEL